MLVKHATLELDRDANRRNSLYLLAAYGAEKLTATLGVRAFRGLGYILAIQEQVGFAYRFQQESRLFYTAELAVESDAWKECTRPLVILSCPELPEPLVTAARDLGDYEEMPDWSALAESTTILDEFYDAIDGLEITARFLDHGDLCELFGFAPEVRSCR